MLKAIICPTCVQSPKIYKLIYSKPYMTEDYSPITTTCMYDKYRKSILSVCLNAG